jgi:hypothetical protein
MIRNNLGILSICLGVMLFVVFYFAGLTSYNVLLYIALFFVLFGAVWQVVKAKKESMY